MSTNGVCTSASSISVEIRDGAIGEHWAKHQFHVKAFESCANFLAERPDFGQAVASIDVKPGASIREDKEAAMLMCVIVTFHDATAPSLLVTAKCPRSHAEYLEFAKHMTQTMTRSLEDAAERSARSHLKLIERLRISA